MSFLGCSPSSLGCELVARVDRSLMTDTGGAGGASTTSTSRIWRGSAFGGAKGRTDVPKIVDWFNEGKIRIDELITHTMPLAEISRAFDLMHHGESIRSVVLM